MKRVIYTIIAAFLVIVHNPAQSIPAEAIVAEGKLSSISLSPNGDFMVVVTNEPHGKDVLIADTKTQNFHLVKNIPFSDALLDTLWIDNNSMALVVRLGNLGGGMEFISISQSNEKLNFKHTPASVRLKGHIVATLPKMEDTVLFAQNIGSKKNIFRLHFATIEDLAQNEVLKSKPFKNRLKGAEQYFLSRDLDSLMAITIEEETPRFWHLDRRSDRWVNFYELNDSDSYFFPIGILANGKMAVLSNETTNVISLLEFDMHTRSYGDILYQHPMYDLTDAALTQDGDRIEYVRYTSFGKPVTNYFSEKNISTKNKLQKAFPNKQILTVSTDDAHRKSIIYVFDSDDPGHFYLFDAKQLSAHLITAAFPALAEYSFTKSKVYNIPTEKGTTIEAILTRPTEYTNNTLLVMPHGGPIGVRDYAIFNPENQYLASQGFSILNVNFRGSIGFGKEFLDQGRGEFGQRIEQDISSAVKYIKTQYKFDKMCSIGSSYGGYSSMMLALENPNEYQCVVAMYGVYDLPLLFNSSNLTSTEKEQKQIESVVGKNSEELKSKSPFYLANKLNSPVLLIAGKDDRVAGFEQSHRMLYRLEKLGKDVQSHFYSGVGHGQHTAKGEEHQLRKISEFLHDVLDL